MRNKIQSHANSRNEVFLLISSVMSTGPGPDSSDPAGSGFHSGFRPVFMNDVGSRTLHHYRARPSCCHAAGSDNRIAEHRRRTGDASLKRVADRQSRPIFACPQTSGLWNPYHRVGVGPTFALTRNLRRESNPLFQMCNLLFYPSELRLSRRFSILFTVHTIPRRYSPDRAPPGRRDTWTERKGRCGFAGLKRKSLILRQGGGVGLF